MLFATLIHTNKCKSTHLFVQKSVNLYAVSGISEWKCISNKR